MLEVMIILKSVKGCCSISYNLLVSEAELSSRSSCVFNTT